MITIVRKDGSVLQVVSGLQRIDAQIQVYGETTVVLGEEVIAVEKDVTGQLVEKTKQIH